MQYDQPTSNEQLNESLSSVSMSQETRDSLNSLLGLDGSGGSTKVGKINFDLISGSLQFEKPLDIIGGGEAPDLVVLDLNDLPPPAPAENGEEPAPVRIEIDPSFMGARGWIFDTDTGIEVEFNTVDRVIVSGRGSDMITVNGDSNTTIESAGGNDTLTTTGGDDLIVSGSGNVSISSGAGSDTIKTGVGNDTIDSGTGFDKVIIDFSGEKATVTKSDNGLVVANGEGNNAITLLNTNFVEFSTGESFTVSNSLEAATAMRLYDTLLERAAEFGGAQYWTDVVGKGASLRDIAEGFATSAEFIEKHGNVFEFETDAFVEKMYDLMLGRASDEAGKAYWADLVNQGVVQRGDMIVFFAESAEAVETYEDTVKFIDDWLL